MAQTIPHPRTEFGAAPDACEPVSLDHERLDVYSVAVAFQNLAAGICGNRRIGANLRDQLDRASVAIVLNIAEGAGRRTVREKAQFFTIARGSATECAAVLDLLEARGLVSAALHRHARGKLVRIVQMLTRLVLNTPGR